MSYTRTPSGERRIIAYGAVAGRVLVCVYTWRGTAEDPLRWIISLRPANREDVRALRARLGLSQEAFAARFGFTVDAIRQYREPPAHPDRARPHPAARVIAREPDAVTGALAGPTPHR